MTHKRLWSITSLLCSLFCLAGGTVSAQELEQDSLHLPEVVITGIDQSKIHRQIPKVQLHTTPPEVMQSSRDDADRLLREGDVLYLASPDKAEQHYLNAAALDPSAPDVYLRLGDVYRTTERPELAAETYHTVLGIAEDLPEAHYRLGILYESQLEAPEKAIEHYQQYIQAGGDDARVHIWLRNLQRRQEPRAPAAPAASAE